MRIFRSPVYWVIKGILFLAGIWLLLWNLSNTIIPDTIAGSDYYFSQLNRPCRDKKVWWEDEAIRENYFDSMGDSLKYAPDSLFPEYLRQISCESNLGLYEHIFAGRRPDSIPELQRANILMVYRSWMRSEMFRNHSIPWTGHLAGLSGPGRFEGEMIEDDMDRIKDLFNDHCFCKSDYKLKERRRKVRRMFRKLVLPFNFLSKKEDWYTIRIIWFRGSPAAKPDGFYATRGSDPVVADEIIKIMKNVTFVEEKNHPDCLIHYIDVDIDMGDGELKVN